MHSNLYAKLQRFLASRTPLELKSSLQNQAELNLNSPGSQTCFSSMATSMVALFQDWQIMPLVQQLQRPCLPERSPSLSIFMSTFLPPPVAAKLSPKQTRCKLDPLFV